MAEVIVRGLADEGPGDIVGAFVNEANISPESIGNISIDGSQATVEVDENVIEPVISEMDGGTIGGSEVSVTELDETQQAVIEYTDKYSELVDLEREEEMRRHEEEIKSLSGNEREEKGRAILHLEGRDEGEGLGGYHVKFVRHYSGEELPDTEITVGDLVMISKQDPLRDDNPTGTVIEKTKYSLTVAFDSKPQGFVFGSGLRIDLYVNDITFQRMQDALETLPDASGSLKQLRDIIVGVSSPGQAGDVTITEWHNTALNESQKSAVKDALAREDFALIHGPPGTGKTTTAIEVIQQCVDRNESVLATAASNTAVDNIVEFLLDQNVDVVRAGHPARVSPRFHEHTLDHQVEQTELYQEADQLREEAFALLDKQEDLTHPSGRWRRGLSDERIKELADEGRGSRGVPPEKIESMAEWLELQDQIDEKFNRAERLEEQAIEQVLTAADVVCTTNSTAGSDLLADMQFDTLIIDEATQATEPSCLIPITHASRVIMAGDHRQLPPTVQSTEAAERGLSTTLFERLAREFDEIRSLLTVQYRMHEDIMTFPSSYFYSGQLRAPPEVRSHTLADLDADIRNFSNNPVLRPEQPVVFVDTSNMEASEYSRPGSTSYENETEARYVINWIQTYLDSGIDPTDIAVISPYDDQVEHIRETVDISDIEIDTVDGFQGREKEIVIVSLVRNNPDGDLGFLTEERRFNVSITRARRKLIIIGDSPTLRNGDVYRSFIEYVDNHDAIISTPPTPNLP